MVESFVPLIFRTLHRCSQRATCNLVSATSSFRFDSHSKRLAAYHCPSFSPDTTMGSTKHKLDLSQPMKSKKRKVKLPQEGSGEDVLLSDVKALLSSQGSQQNEESTAESVRSTALPFARFDEIEVNILEISSLGKFRLSA
jgi:hypothetical protein